MTRVLFLNNKNPVKYNAKFFSDYFDIPPNKIRNLFNYISYPIFDS